MKRPKPPNRAQRRKNEMLQAMERLKAQSYNEGVVNGIRIEHKRLSVMFTPNEFGFVDLSRVQVADNCRFVRIPAPTSPMARIPQPDAPYQAHKIFEFQAEPMQIDLPNGATAGYYVWKLIGTI